MGKQERGWLKIKLPYDVNRQGYLILYINPYHEIRPMIIDASNKDELKTIVDIRGIKNVIYIKSLNEVVTKYEQLKEVSDWWKDSRTITRYYRIIIG